MRREPGRAGWHWSGGVCAVIGEKAAREEARAAIFEYIEVFYNRERIHGSLGYVSPEEFEASRR